MDLLSLPEHVLLSVCSRLDINDIVALGKCCKQLFVTADILLSDINIACKACGHRVAYAITARPAILEGVFGAAGPSVLLPARTMPSCAEPRIHPSTSLANTRVASKAPSNLKGTASDCGIRFSEELSSLDELLRNELWRAYGWKWAMDPSRCSVRLQHALCKGCGVLHGIKICSVQRVPSRQSSPLHVHVDDQDQHSIYPTENEQNTEQQTRRSNKPAPAHHHGVTAFSHTEQSNDIHTALMSLRVVCTQQNPAATVTLETAGGEGLTSYTSGEQSKQSPIHGQQMNTQFHSPATKEQGSQQSPSHSLSNINNEDVLPIAELGGVLLCTKTVQLCSRSGLMQPFIDSRQQQEESPLCCQGKRVMQDTPTGPKLLPEGGCTQQLFRATDIMGCVIARDHATQTHQMADLVTHLPPGSFKLGPPRLVELLQGDLQIADVMCSCCVEVIGCKIIKAIGSLGIQNKLRVGRYAIFKFATEPVAPKS